MASFALLAALVSSWTGEPGALVPDAASEPITYIGLPITPASGIRLTRMPFNSAKGASFTCVVLSAAGAERRLQILRDEVASKASGSCASLWHILSITPDNDVYTDALSGEHGTWLQSNFKSGAASLMLTNNATLSYLLQSTNPALGFPAIIFEDDAILHPNFDALLKRAYNAAPDNAAILQLGLEGTATGSGACAGHAGRVATMADEAGDIGPFTPPALDKPNDFWHPGLGWAVPAMLYEREGAVELTSRMGDAAHGASPGSEWCGAIAVGATKPDYPDGCWTFRGMDVWLAHGGQHWLNAEPGAIVHVGRAQKELSWPKDYETVLTHDAQGDDAVHQCGLVLQARSTADVLDWPVHGGLLFMKWFLDREGMSHLQGPMADEVTSESISDN